MMILRRQRISHKQTWIIQSIVMQYSTQKKTIEDILQSKFMWGKKDITRIMQNTNGIQHVKPDELLKSIRRLNLLQLRKSDIKLHPKLLLQNEHQLLNNYQRLLEVGFREATAYRLANVEELFSSSVQFNQSFNFLPKDINIIHNIFSMAKVPIEIDASLQYAQSMQLELVHRMGIRYYLRSVNYSPQDIDYIWQNHQSVKNRSVQSLFETVTLLENFYKTSVCRLPRKTLTLQPENLREMLASETVVDVRKLVLISTKCNLDRIREIEILCFSHRIPNYVLVYTPRLYNMNIDTLTDCINKISELKRGKEFLQHAAVGRLISCMGRLQKYTNSRKVRFKSIFNDNFADFFLNGFLFKPASMFYMCNVFNKTEDEIKDALNDHPHSNVYSFSVVFQNIKYLSEQGFSLEDIFRDLPIVLYSIDEIKDFFGQLSNSSEMKKLNIEPTTLSKSQILRLCMYLIEKKCDFNGDGIYLRSHVTEFTDAGSLKLEGIIQEILKNKSDEILEKKN